MSDEKTVQFGPVTNVSICSEEAGDVEPIHAKNGNVMDDGLQRGFKMRHLQMIALGGVVGLVFLFNSSGSP